MNGFIVVKGATKLYDKKVNTVGKLCKNHSKYDKLSVLL